MIRLKDNPILAMLHDPIFVNCDELASNRAVTNADFISVQRLVSSYFGYLSTMSYIQTQWTKCEKFNKFN